MAYKEKVPDFSLGLMADVKAAPALFRPLAGMTLPVWRDKIAAEIAQARAAELAARARLDSEQIALTVDVAEESFANRELGRNLALLQDLLIPKARLSLEIARAGYLAGTIDFFNLMDAERTLLNFELSEVEARTQREIVLAELSLRIARCAARRRAGADRQRHASTGSPGNLTAIITMNATFKTFIPAAWTAVVVGLVILFDGCSKPATADSTAARPKRFTPAACTRRSSRIIPAIARSAA